MSEILEYAIELFFLWLFYKLIFEFIIPLIHTARQFRKQVHQVKQQMEDHYQQRPEPDSRSQASAHVQEKEGEYIEFEELK